MPKTAVQSPTCDICGAEVREGSLFCYHCGGSLKPEDRESTQISEVPTALPVPTNGNTKTAKATRRESRQLKRAERGPVEVVWAPREGISLIYLVAGTVLLIIAISLFVVAMLLK